MKTVQMVAMWLVLVGGLNWGLVGLFQFDLVQTLVGPLANVVYILVGLSAAYLLYDYTMTGGKKKR